MVDYVLAHCRRIGDRTSVSSPARSYQGGVRALALGVDQPDASFCAALEIRIVLGRGSVRAPLRGTVVFPGLRVDLSRVRCVRLGAHLVADRLDCLIRLARTSRASRESVAVV